MATVSLAVCRGGNDEHLPQTVVSNVVLSQTVVSNAVSIDLAKFGTTRQPDTKLAG